MLHVILRPEELFAAHMSPRLELKETHGEEKIRIAAPATTASGESTFPTMGKASDK